MKLTTRFVGPPERTNEVVQIARSGHGADPQLIVEISVNDGQLTLGLFPELGQSPWNFVLSDFLEAIGKGVAVIERVEQHEREWQQSRGSQEDDS